MSYDELTARLLRKTEQQADRIEQLEAALRWYEGKTHLVRLIHSEGDPARAALVADGGAKARAALEGRT